MAPGTPAVPLAFDARARTRKDVNDFKKHVRQAKLDWQVRVNSSRDGGYTAIFHFYVPGAYLSDYWQQKSVMRFISLVLEHLRSL